MSHYLVKDSYFATCYSSVTRGKIFFARLQEPRNGVREPEGKDWDEVEDDTLVDDLEDPIQVEEALDAT